MPPKQRVTHMFPHRVILVTSFVLCACATCSILLSVLSWYNKLWGYYFRTGIWSGVVILITGILGILCNYVRSVSAVKTFLIAAIFGVIVSLALIALSAGGLDVESGFYRGRRENAYLNNICHGVSLGVGVLELTLCILCDGICIYYLFIDNSQMYKVGDAKAKKKNSHKPKRDPSRASTRSDAPLVGSPSKPKSPRNKKKQRSRSYDDEDQDYQVEYRKPSRLLEGQTLSPNRSPCIRPSSFSTFGRADTGDQASLIVHPGDTTSIADTNRSQTPSVATVDECHYAQTMLFDPPLPIEEDEELPPYQVVDPYSKVSISSHGVPSSNSPLRRSNSTPLHSNKRNAVDRHRPTTARSSIPRGRSQKDNKTPDTSFLKDSLQKHNASKRSPTIRHSQSADLLKVEERSLMDQQGVSCRDFASIHNDDTVVKRRSNSVRGDRSKRLDRKRRALSAEIKVSREHILTHGHGMGSRTSSIDGSNCGLFASNRIIPTKFSLRTPVRQTGMPHVRSAIPVKSVASLPLFSPPPKPPRTFSVKAEDFKIYVNEPIDQEENVFTETGKEINDSTDSAVRNSVPGAADEIKDESKDITLIESKENAISVNGTMVIDTGPVLKCKAPLQNIPNLTNTTIKNDKESDTLKNNDKNIIGSSQGETTAVMELPLSPTVKCPIDRVQKSNESSAIYAKINKNHNKQGVTTLLESQKITNKIKKDDTNGQNSESTEMELSIEDKQSVSVKHTAGVNNIKDKPPSDKENEREKLANEIEKHQNLHVRIPPLSPSQRILNRKPTQNKESPVLANTSKSSDSETGATRAEHNGARPKTGLHNRGKDNNSAYPVPTRRRSIEASNTSTSLSSSPNTNRFSLPPDKSPRKHVGSLNQSNSLSSKTSVPVNSKPQVFGSSNRHSISTTNNVPNRSNAGSLMSARSQGILHLPQSQHNRHLPTDRQGTSNTPPVNQVPVANQNQQNRDELANALYAKIL